MRTLTRLRPEWLIAPTAAALLASEVSSSVDYGAGMKTGDSPLPAITALLHGDLAAVAHHQPVIGLTSILLRAPFVALAALLQPGTMPGYRLGVFACALAAGLVSVAVYRRARAAGRSLAGAAAFALLMVVNPLTIGAQLGGHPEELLGGALCVAAVLAAAGERPLAAGALLGLAFATKQWTIIAAVPVLLACPRKRLRIVAAAAAVGAPLALALPLADPHAFARAAALIGTLKEVSLISWWWPFSHAHTVTVRVIGGMATATSHTLPFGLTRSAVAWLAPVAAVAVGSIFHRARRRPAAAELLGLLALVLLLRCALDPSCVSYYHVPFVTALLAWEALAPRRTGLVSALAIVGLWGLFSHVSQTAPLVCGYLILSAGLTIQLASVLFRRDPRALELAAHRPEPLIS
jgi:hypothetical protein